MQNGREIPATITAHNWTHFRGIRSYDSTAFRAGGLGSKHSTSELRTIVSFPRHGRQVESVYQIAPTPTDHPALFMVLATTALGNIGSRRSGNVHNSCTFVSC